MNQPPADAARLAELLEALDNYRPARQAFLKTLGLPSSNRDPFAEFSEQFVAYLMGGTLATSRVQAGHDFVVTASGHRVQVRYLANPGVAWVNEHRVYWILDVELYALVVLEAFEVVGVLVFALDSLLAVCQALGKRHPQQSTSLQFTRRNWWTIRDDPDRFRALGMLVWIPPFDSEATPTEGSPLESS